MDPIKRLWVPLCWVSLATLVGVAWFAVRWGVSLSSLLDVGMVGMAGACVLAFHAMIRRVRAKWPAALALACAGPMTLHAIDAIAYLPTLVRYLGLPIVLVYGGTFATVLVSIKILARPLPVPPQAEPVPVARVVD
jgi:hypothetical protein